jgi:hypothetical protein
LIHAECIGRNDECARNELEETKLLYDRKSAARALSISIRSVDYLVARKELKTRRIGKKVLIPAGELRRFAAADHFGPIDGREAA